MKSPRFSATVENLSIRDAALLYNFVFLFTNPVFAEQLKALKRGEAVVAFDRGTLEVFSLDEIAFVLAQRKSQLN